MVRRKAALGTSEEGERGCKSSECVQHCFESLSTPDNLSCTRSAKCGIRCRVVLEYRQETGLVGGGWILTRRTHHIPLCALDDPRRRKTTRRPIRTHLGEIRDDRTLTSALSRSSGRGSHLHRRLQQGRSAHRQNRQGRTRRRRGQALEAHARHRQGDANGFRRRQVGVRSGEARRPSRRHGRESRPAQDEIRRFRGHGACRVRGRTGCVSSFPRQRRATGDEGEVVVGVLSSPLAGSLVVPVGWLVVAVLGLVPTNNAFFARRIAFPLGPLAGVALAAFGLQAVWLPTQTLTLPLGLPDLPFHLRIDPLAGFFLMLLGSVSAGISVYSAGDFRAEPSGRLALISLPFHLVVASVGFLLVAYHAFLLMRVWETM